MVPPTMMELDPGPSPAVAVIGAAGFIGRPLCARLAATGGGAVAVVRQKTDMPAGVEVRASGSLSPTTDWTPLLRGTDRLVYLASRAHAALPAAAIEAWIAAEAATVAACARAAAAGGIDRIILMSSIKVLGEATEATAFTADTPPAPRDAYGRAKWAMEQAISGPSVTVIRPPLVYGPGVKANFKALLRLVDKGLPLPLA
jgi:nucleoside-diphosphate-sugar epimerase